MAAAVKPGVSGVSPDARSFDVQVRAAQPSEGRAIAALWRELWDAHEAWGGYAGSHDQRVYDQLALRLQEDARVRAGHPVLGRHIHLISAMKREVTGQVEGWLERHGVEETTPNTCEVRSLIVRESARMTGSGRALLEALARTAASLGRGLSVVLAAEVLEPNPAHGFYERLGYRPISYSARIDTSAPPAEHGAAQYAARVAESRDALAVAVLDATLAARRRSVGDLRFDRPRAVEATLVGAIAAHLARSSASHEPAELVVVDARGDIRASATLAVTALDPPFLPAKRAILGRFALDSARDPRPIVVPLVALACRIAGMRGAATMELTDLTAPGTPLYEAVLATGARPWSRVVARHVTG
jgi:GNAT superfamily N-acetyltransferase